MLFTANAFVRRDKLTLRRAAIRSQTSRGRCRGSPVDQRRRRVDVAYSAGNHNVKVGGTIGATKLTENFGFGITDPESNSPSSPDYNRTCARSI